MYDRNDKLIIQSGFVVTYTFGKRRDLRIFSYDKYANKAYTCTHTHIDIYTECIRLHVMADVHIQGILSCDLFQPMGKIYPRHLEMPRVFVANDRIFSWRAREVRRQGR